eukprot:gnl/MRDRNA2_/MRDRNA2_87809_c0_seq1.p1 gnl/MRDRNA2_/MRDRNA2_87809_c0~~gnl/MRDRNA2_/MRDRNA2_87809_c0_seq1.p1  ORF type:complete len:690 (-),score=179.32 gnl/MRDRNA2_/MRDRNA2_87809_c0_seq1:235-2304(-)
MQFCQSLNEQALQLAEGPAEGIERILRQSRASVPVIDDHETGAESSEPAGEPLAEDQCLAVQAAGQPAHAANFDLPPFPEGLAESIEAVQRQHATPLHQQLGEMPMQQDLSGFQLPVAAGDSIPVHVGDMPHGFDQAPQVSTSQHDIPQMPQMVSSPSRARQVPRNQQIAQRHGDEQVLDMAQQIENRNLSRLLDTPRTKEACKRTGILPSELRVKALSDFAIIGDRPERQRLRFDHYENKRQEKLKLVLAERTKIMHEKIHDEMLGAAKGFQSLQMMEELLDKEAKRQEKALKNQVRMQNTVEKENEQQLEKERQLSRKQVEILEKNSKAEAMKQARALEIKASHEAKEAQAKALQIRNEQELEMRQAGYLANQLEEEVRLREFRKQKELAMDVQNSKWQEKQQMIAYKHEQLEEERRAQGEALLSNYHSKLEQMDKRREDELMSKMLKHEESQLRLEDAMEKKSQLERQFDHHRQQVASKLDSQAQRVDTFLTLKDHLLQQNKFRARQKSATRERALNLKNLTPGPADYNSDISTLKQAPVAKISNANLKPVEGSIDEMIQRNRSLPPPGSYDPKVLPTGGYALASKGPKIVAGTKESYLHDLQKQAKYCPGPGSYDNGKSTMLLEHVAAMRRDYMQVPEGRAAAWAAQGDKCGPGPAAYALDKFSRQNRMKSQKSLPTLSKAMNLG